ncbi:MAG TPA: SdrD B-like domain-containing protein [Pirellulales bacterium]
MKTTLFAQWRRGGSKTRHTRKTSVRGRDLRVEMLEGRALLTASAVSTYSPYDVNHDGYLNMSDLITTISYYNSHGPSVASTQSSSTGSGSSLTATPSALTAPTSTATTDVDVNGDGYINLSDVIKEIKAFDNLAPLAAYTLVPTNASDQPLSGPLVVGQTFYLDVMVQDLRTDSGGQPLSYDGVAGGDVDVAYVPDSTNPGGVAPVTPLSISWNTANYPNPTTATARADVTSTVGVMKNINGSEANNGPNFSYIPLGSGVLLLNRIQMTATAAGVVNFNSEILNPLLETTVLASGTGLQDITDALQLTANQISLGSASVTVVNAPPVPSSLSGQVYVDNNGDNTFDAGDVGLPNVVVALLNSSGAATGATQITDANGNYSFTNLNPGTYGVAEVQPSGFFETGLNVGTVNGTASGTASGVNTISSVVITSGSVGAGYNFAVQSPAGISGTAYVDQNADGVFDAGDTTLAGVSVQLFNSSNVAVGSAVVTGANGTYSFPGQQPGTYTIKETPPSGAFATAANVGTINGTSTGTVNDAATISAVTVGSGSAAIGYNFGLEQFATISGTEYVDNDANNSFNSGDTGLGGVTIQLINASNQIVSTTTAANGTFSFTGVVPGTYSLVEGTPGSGLVQTSSTVGSVSGTQVGVDTISTIVLGNGVAATGYNFGTQSNVPPLAQVRLATTALDGGALPSVIPGGSKFWLYEYVTDLRQPTSDALGVEEAYTNISYDTSKFAVVSPLTFGSNYQFSESPSNGQIPSSLINVGALAGTSNFPSLGFGAQGNQEMLVFKVEMQAIGGGSSDITVGQPTSSDVNPVGIAVFADPPAFDSPLLTSSQVHFVGLGSVQTTQPTFVSIDTPVAVTNGTTSGATTPLNFTIHLSQASSVPITVTYTTEDIGSDNAVGGATASTPGADYVLPDFDGTPANENVGQFTIPANTTDLTVPLVQAIGNSLNQADKSFHIVLTSGDNNIVVSQAAGSSQAIIHSAVAQPTLTVLPVSGNEGDVATFNVSLSAGSGQTITVHYQTQATSPQSAIPGTDFQVVTGDLTFLPSSTGSTQQVQIALPFDASEVPPTTFQFVLSSATNAALSGGSSQLAVLGTILPPATGSLSGYVYHDINSDGLREGGETGYAGVAITLTGTTIYGQQVTKTATTAADGSYSFVSLVAGRYTIAETQPLLYLQGKDHIGTQGGSSAAQDQFFIDLDAGVAGTENDFGEGDLNPNMFWWPNF